MIAHTLNVRSSRSSGALSGLRQRKRGGGLEGARTAGGDREREGGRENVLGSRQR